MNLDNDKIILEEIEKEDAFDPANRENKVQDEIYERGIFYNLLMSLKENKLAIICLIILIIIIIASLLAPLSSYDPDAMDLRSKLLLPNKEHFFGTDNLGRDYFTRALYGGRVSLTVGFFSMLVSVIVGTIYGTISGYIGGTIDNLMMRAVDIFMSVPSFLLIIIINSFLSPSMFTMVVIIGMFSWMGVARIVRAETMSLKERDFVLAAKNMGAGNMEIMLIHIIPNMIPSIIVAASISIARAILTESSLSFLGFGVKLPMSSWGSMLQNAQSQIMDLPTLALFPGALILLTVLSFNVLGDVLRNALEPKMVK
ncbi:ABC transporter permease [Fusicatenibacter saccharivorans]|uniref:ABC transporter permease n=1 Tax=Fusicatenibacter saccharivorans TaxID=1150298 RepID=UPI003D01CD3E